MGSSTLEISTSNFSLMDLSLKQEADLVESALMAKVLQLIYINFECSCVCLNVLSDRDIKSFSLLLNLTNNWAISYTPWSR